MAPSNSMRNRRSLAEAGRVKDFRYQPVPEIGGERPFDGPVVRQAELGPLLVGEAGLLGARRFAFIEAPAVVEIEAPLVSHSDGSGSRQQTGAQRQEQTESP